MIDRDDITVDEEGRHGKPNVPRHDSDQRILTRAARRPDWIMPKRTWEDTPEYLQTFVDNDKNEVRERISAARGLIAMARDMTALQSIDLRINQAIAVVAPPAAPEDVDVEIQPAFIESVQTDDLDDTVRVLEGLGLLDRYVEQVKTSAVPSTNGNGNGKSPRGT